MVFNTRCEMDLIVLVSFSFDILLCEKPAFTSLQMLPVLREILVGRKLLCTMITMSCKPQVMVRSCTEKVPGSLYTCYRNLQAFTCLLFTSNYVILMHAFTANKLSIHCQEFKYSQIVIILFKVVLLFDFIGFHCCWLLAQKLVLFQIHFCIALRVTYSFFSFCFQISCVDINAFVKKIALFVRKT